MEATQQAPQEAPSNVKDLCEEMTARRLDMINKDLGPWPKNNPTASDISDCERETVLGMTNWADRPPFPPEVRARLERGNVIENHVIRDLALLGYTVRVERTPFEIKDKKNRIVLRGRMDGFIDYAKRKTAPIEIKSLNPNIYNQIHTQEDFDRYTFFRKYPRQLQSYMYAYNFEEGMWILDDCLGHQKFIPCTLDFDRVDAILKQLESAVEHRENGTLPDYHKDPSVCMKCWAFKRICTPPFFTGEGIKMIDDPELESKLEEWGRLKPEFSAYTKIDKELKELFKERDNLVIGKWLVKGTLATRSMKAQPAKEAQAITYWKSTIEKIDNSPEEEDVDD